MRHIAPQCIGVLIVCLVAAPVGKLCHAVTPNSGQTEDAAATIALEARIAGNIAIKNRELFQAVASLSRELKFRYSLEYRTSDLDTCNPYLDLVSADGMTLRELLDALVAKAPGWQWRADEGVVNFIYGKLDSASDWPLNNKHPRVSISSGRASLDQALKAYIPEMKPAMYGCLDPFEVRTKHAPRPTFQLEHVTLRSALNRFVTSAAYLTEGVYYSWRFCGTADGYPCERR